MKERRKHKIHKRITVGVLAASLFMTLPGMEKMKAFAGQAEVQGTELSEAADKVYSLYAGVDLKEAEGTEFGTKNLIVSTSKEDFDTLGAEERISFGDGVYVLSYPDSESAKTACKSYQEMEGIDFAEADSVVKAQTEEQKDGTQEESLDEKEEPEEEGNGKDDSTVKETEDKEDGTSGETADAKEEPLDAEKEADTKEPGAGQESGNDVENSVAAEEAETGATEDLPEETAEDDIVRVALLDTGVKTDIGNLASYIQDTGINASGSGDVGNTSDDNSHGTAMAQVIVSALEENGKDAEDVKLLPVKVLDHDGYGTTLTIYLGMRAAMEQGTDIICLGLSGKADSRLLESAVDEAYNAGITVIGAAGNDASDVAKYVPGRFEKAIIISNVKNQEEAVEDTNYGGTVDFSAYGIREVLSLAGEVQTVSGTSIACAYVTGVTASFEKGMSCKETEAELLKRAVPATEESLTPYMGKGMIGNVPEKETAAEEKKTENQSAEKTVQKAKGVGKPEDENTEIKKAGTKTLGAAASDGYYYFAKGTDISGVSVPEGYHLKKIKTITCEHSADDDGLLYFRCNLTKIKPSKSELKDLKNYSYSNSFKDRITLEVVDLKNSEVNNLGTNKAQVAHYMVYAYIDDVCIGLAAAPYKCMSDHYHDEETCGYAGYVYYSYKMAKCSRDGKLYEVKITQKWQHCTRAGIDPTENVVIYNSGASHRLDQYELEANTATIQYHANGGSANTSKGYALGTDNLAYKDGTKVTKSVDYTTTTLNLHNVGTLFTRTGYHVDAGVAWRINSASGSTISQNDDTSAAPITNLIKNGDATITLYANWKPNTYTVKFKSNGGTGSMADQAMTYGTAQKLTVNRFTRIGYDFVGWNTQEKGDGTSYSDGQSVMNLTTVNNGTVTLYAQWKLKTYTIQYDANGGTGTMEDGTKTYGKDYTIKDNAFIHNGYDFVEWNTKADGSGTSYAEGAVYKEEKSVTLYAIWKEHFNVAYIGNGQTQGTDFIDAGEDGYGHSEKLDYTFDDNKEKDEEEENPEDYFQKTETATYTDEETGETVNQEIEGTVVGWAIDEENAKSDYGLGEVVHGETLVNRSKTYGNFTIGSPGTGYNEFQENSIVANAMSSVRGSAATSATIPSLGGVGTVYNDTPYVNMYAVWDMGPVIEAYDRYYTLEEAQNGFIITEEELLNAAKATDEEAKSGSNEEGRLKNFLDEENQTSFTVMDYQAEEFTGLTGSAVISVTYRAEDAAGNVTKKMILVHIVDGHDTIIDGYDIGTEPDEGKVRFISEKYLDTLDEDSVWVKNEEYREALLDTLSYRRLNPEQSDPLPLWGDNYTVDIPGTGEWNKTPQSVWRFTREQVKEAQQFVEDYGPSNYEHEDGLQKFYEKFAECRQEP